MIRFVLALIFIQAFYCAQFPDIKNHIKLRWNDVILDQKIDASQTVSDEEGTVKNFIFCANFNSADDTFCTYDQAFAEWTSGGFNFSESGSGNFTTKLVSKVNETYYCLQFLNPVYGSEEVGGFMKIYQETLQNSGNWEVNYLCGSSVVPDKGFPWWIVIVVVVVLVIVGAVLGVMYWKKKKAGKERLTTSGGDGLLQYA